MLQGKKILLGITGSIAAYKTATLVRLLVKAGAEVRVVMTRAAGEFITPLTLGTLSKGPVLTDLATADTWANHVMLGRWADVMVVAPLSCNTLAKMASGQCDNLLLAVYLSATCPVVLAPAMDEDMWHHPATRQNLAKVISYGNRVIPVVRGELASGLVGDGRMAEPEAILAWLETFFHAGQALQGKRVLVTGGPTHEPIDPVRFIGNHSSGKMGIALAMALADKGALVTLVLGPVTQRPSLPGLEVIDVLTASEMYDACVTRWPAMDIGVMAAAVADYTPVTVAEEKIKKQPGTWALELTKTKDILQALGAAKHGDQLLVGFALETRDEKSYALGKLEAKNADLIVLNSLRDAGAGFGYDTNKITIFDRQGTEHSFGLKSKDAVARDIADVIVHTLESRKTVLR
ncbi:MAG TPA: bifunctional phosphopantothenoylcysteine decarboxylase/phosphopantothenate--cysteine ligase CoaBC [Dinghuibacter sp.]|uniref:bifunctional phosphopantothenoylcysteine decarboxylase/phosphopantothenate--cysteine ligase CoaBC n=1 Tax=Dinghuibacter sp. TaxID=2024697 RepID=UPI002CED8078|nr:bifunctional phosphopantothenoylcysteine decarboxylase/phosphopantothenate--cysteine ligase CoaBC [Dinghuibacter sp.]HTJ13811.1 bifunctional phosphopantothenoylcysteine decarboxylase/phosphopantothenate--cysteine ligase CoaBC [Dinghuibacter sp.]